MIDFLAVVIYMKLGISGIILYVLESLYSVLLMLGYISAYRLDRTTRLHKQC